MKTKILSNEDFNGLLLGYIGMVVMIILFLIEDFVKSYAVYVALGILFFIPVIKLVIYKIFQCRGKR
jgi:hypothetical protein